MGIKSHGEEGGLDVVTHEVVNGKRVKLTDSFRQYDSPEDSIRGYGSFLKANSRYKYFLRAGAENEDAQLSALQTSGYATDPKYSFKLRTIMNGLPGEEGQGETPSHNPPRVSRALPVSVAIRVWHVPHHPLL